MLFHQRYPLSLYRDHASLNGALGLKPHGAISLDRLIPLTRWQSWRKAQTGSNFDTPT